MQSKIKVLIATSVPPFCRRYVLNLIGKNPQFSELECVRTAALHKFRDTLTDRIKRKCSFLLSNFQLPTICYGFLGRVVELFLAAKMKIYNFL